MAIDMKKLEKLAVLAEKSTIIPSELYNSYDCKRGLRDENGNGVLVGLTDISDIIAQKDDGTGNKIPCNGELYYRGISIEDIVKGFVKEKRFGYEESTYLLLFGKLPNAKELEDFKAILDDFRQLSTNFIRDVIMKKPSEDMMNIIERCVLTYYAYDENPDGISLPNVLKQCLELSAKMPLFAVYGYQVRQYYNGSSLILHPVDPKMSTAETILRLLREDGKFTPLEARLLDLCLVLHAEHGGGNNSSFTMHVVSSSHTDTYSAVCAALGSLKGPRHGGANVKVVKMVEDLKKNGGNLTDGEIRDYFSRVLDKKAFDNTGLIYGMGHAVYSLSDPRAKILKSFIKELAVEKGSESDYELYRKIERIAPEIICEKRKIYKGVSANIDFYSGFVYKMLGLPVELYTPIFAISRMAGWSAHRIEELANNGKIIRPGYVSVTPHKEYVKLSDRK